MKTLIVCVGLLMASLAHANVIDLTMEWTPDPTNTVQAEAYTITRQDGTQVCTGTTLQCVDEHAPDGQSCYTATATAKGKTVTSEPFCMTIEQVVFIGKLVIMGKPHDVNSPVAPTAPGGTVAPQAPAKKR